MRHRHASHGSRPGLSRLFPLARAQLDEVGVTLKYAADVGLVRNAVDFSLALFSNFERLGQASLQLFSPDGRAFARSRLTCWGRLGILQGVLNEVSEVEVLRLGSTIRGSIIAALAVCSAGSAIAGHPAAECRTYATNAVNQFHQLKAAGCQPKPGDSMWSDYYQGHYSWCLSTNADINQQYKQRQLAIDACVAHSDQICRTYANDAIAQVNAFVHKGCILGNGNAALWGRNPQDHYNWCRANIGADLAQQHKLRRLATDNCMTAGAGGTASPPAITVSIPNPGSNTFVVKGSNFVANAVITIRVTGAGLQTLTYQSRSDASGRFTANATNVCRTKGIVYFAASDGRNNGNLWSNPVASRC